MPNIKKELGDFYEQYKQFKCDLHKELLNTISYDSFISMHDNWPFDDLRLPPDDIIFGLENIDPLIDLVISRIKHNLGNYG
jgi:hypothetical protein